MDSLRATWIAEMTGRANSYVSKMAIHFTKAAFEAEQNTVRYRYAILCSLDIRGGLAQLVERSLSILSNLRKVACSTHAVSILSFLFAFGLCSALTSLLAQRSQLNKAWSQTTVKMIE